MTWECEHKNCKKYEQCQNKYKDDNRQVLPFPCGDLIECNKNCGLYSRCVKDDFPTNKEVWKEWLKQPHRERSNHEAD